MTTDAIDRALNLNDDSALYLLRRQRPEFVEGAELCRKSVLSPLNDVGLEGGLRISLAARMARIIGDPRLIAQFDQLNTKIDDRLAMGEAADKLDGQQAALAYHVDLITKSPALATEQTIAKLSASGIDRPQIVALSELIAFVSFQARIINGLGLIAQAAAENREFEELHLCEPNLASSSLPVVKIRPLTWHPYIEPVKLEEASSEQLEAMKVTPSAKKVSPYVRTLAHDPESYVARTVLFNAIMYAENGLPRTERELGALGASVVNGCAYCAMIHGRQYAHLTKGDKTISALWYQRFDLLSDKERAVWDFAVSLSQTPAEAGLSQYYALRSHNMSDFEIVDLIHAVAIFGWANRLMHVLGHATL